jgi:CRISPR-associated protein Cas1
LFIHNQIPVLYLTQTGEYLGRVENPSKLQAKYLTYQRRRARDTEFNRATAESIIWAKLHNQHTFLQSWTRYHANHTIQRALNYLTLLMDNLPLAPGIDELDEYSKEADNIYYCAVGSLLSFYNGSSYTTAKRINGLLNLGNQLLHQYIYTLLFTAGLDPNYPILHCDDRHELPLAWDFTAEFRAPIVDDLVLNFARNLTNSNAMVMAMVTAMVMVMVEATHTIFYKSFCNIWEAKLRTFVLHPYAGEVSYRQCLDLQVREYRASLMGDVEFYRPLALKFRPLHSDFTNTIQPQTVPLKLVKR